MKKIIHIKGMHCISCEVILEKELKNISGVELIMISHKKGIMEIDFENIKDYERVVEIIKKNNFKVIENNKKDKKENNILSNIIAILVVIILFMLSKIFNLYSLIPNTSTLSYSSAFLIGIVASLSTCLAITGGIIIGFSRYVDSTKSTLGHLKIQLGFQFGRILGFFILGGILGHLGKIFTINFSITGIITFIVGGLLLYMGLNILGIMPSLTKFGVHMPKSFIGKIERIGYPKLAPLSGALTFFLPCGFTQTMQLLAVSSGSFLIGGLVMMFFALGTFPILFSVGLGTSYFKDKKFGILNKIIGIIVVLFGILTLTNSYNLISVKTPKNNTIPTNTNSQIKQEIIYASHNGSSMVPDIIELQSGRNYKLIITPTSDGLGCMSTQLIPGLSDKVSYIKKGIPIIYDIYNAQVGTYNIICSAMGMLQGKIIIK
ncbi:MAG: sulfite exporter TauE/SafE family protein [Candidatus Gracilibacteria bacterium]|nr:sulfite exporter TauE/SafE family protein [Candidatus Gracilibacteria bacterium]